MPSNNSLDLLQHSIAELSISLALSQSITNALKDANQNMEKATRNVTENFLEIAEQAQIQREIIRALTKDENPAITEKAEKTTQVMHQSIQKIIKEMQFQDRNSQLLEQIILMLDQHSQSTESLIKETQPDIDSNELRHMVKKLATEMLGSNYFSAMKTAFIAALYNQSITIDESFFEEEDTADESDQDIELF